MSRYIPFVISESVILFMSLALIYFLKSDWATTAIIVAFASLTILNILKVYPQKVEK